ncbi:MAG: hypothetical protein KGQ45_16655 [Burkholderiales bacterium]|nr:hypothetical protein [Burkholderiales bacterium]
MHMRKLFVICLLVASCLAGATATAAPTVDFTVAFPDKEPTSLKDGRKTYKVRAYRVALDPQQVRGATHAVSDRDMVWDSGDLVLGTSSEIKPVTYDGQKALLLDTDSGAIIIAYDERKPKNAPARVLFHRELTGDGADSMNVHSAEVLPDGNVVIADSNGYLYLLAKPGDARDVHQPMAQSKWYELDFAHGVVWDQRSERLYALGHDKIAVFAYRAGATPAASALVLQTTFDIGRYYERCQRYPAVCPEDGNWKDGGHDLYPVPGTRKLFVTTGERVFTFDLDANRAGGAAVLEPYAPMFAIDSTVSRALEKKSSKTGRSRAEELRVVLKKGGVKSISQVPGSRIVLAQAAPWFASGSELSYHYDRNTLLVATRASDRPDVDLSDALKIQLPKSTWFYKARVLDWQTPATE